MLIFSEVHDWQGNSAIKQVLVFTSTQERDSFKAKFAAEVAKVGIEYASENGLGVAFKLRALKTSAGTWAGVIRCGSDGYLQYDMLQCETNHTEALKKLASKLKELLSTDLDNFVNSLG
jgi:hypothetical protein